MRKLLTYGFVILFCAAQAQVTKRNSSTDFEPNTLIIKVKDEFRADCKDDAILNSRLSHVFGKIGLVSVAKEFPGHTKPVRDILPNGMKATDISLIYRLKYSSGANPWSIVPALMRTKMFEYAEPSFRMHLLYTPDDPQLSDVYFLDTIKAFEAWDVNKGDTNVVIGISDTGIDIDHPDLVDNIKYNYADPINGTDDDGDGYIDNYRGWDLGDNDNDPTLSGNWHGVFVSGIAGAHTDNANQLAGVGFKCKLLPIKISNAANSLVGAYQSIVYAADHNVDVINCSWGSPNSWSQQGQDIVKYATVDKNCLVVSSAGNANNDDVYYPASFEWALSVGGTDTLNQKWVQSASEGSNYNEWVDIVAPSVSIMRINNGGGTLGGGRGTSFSSPMVAGAAGIVKSQFPSYSAIQVMETLKATADSIESIPFNNTYTGEIGEGLLNMYRAVTETTNPGFIMDAVQYTDGQDGLFTDGETISIYGNLYNFLATSSAASKMTISTESPYVEWVDSVRVFGSIPGGAGGSTSGIPFRFKVKAGTPASTVVNFKIVFEDGSYNTKQMISTTLNVDYLTTNINDLGFTIGASGKTGYNVAGQQQQGVGLTISGGSTVLYQMGLIAAVDGTKSSFVLDSDWETQEPLSYTYPGVESDLDVLTVFDDDPAAANKIGLTMKQKTLVWDDSDRRKFIIVEYNAINTSGSAISGLHLGLFADWDIGTYSNNIAVYDSSAKTGYSYEPSGSYAGVHILSDSSFQHYALNNDGSDGSINTYDGFISSEQYTSVSSGNGRDSAGVTDISQVVGVGGIEIPAGDSVTIAFAIVAGTSLDELKEQALEADTAYRSIRIIDLLESHNQAASCKDTCDAQAGVVASSGIGPYTFSWNDLGTQTTDTATGLCAGTYTCTVSDAIGNQNTIDVTVTEPTALLIDITDTIMELGGACIGEINGNVSGGTPTYSIAWEDDGGRDTMHAVNLCQGEYRLMVTDANGCVAKDTITITDVVGSDDLIEIGGVDLFPNPASNMISIKGIERGQTATIKLLDVQGRTVLNSVAQGSEIVNVDIESISPGTYILRVESGGMLREEKVIKQ